MKLILVLFIFIICFQVLCISEYKVVSTTKTASNITLELEYFGKDEFYGKPASPIIKKLKFFFQGLVYNLFYFKITDLQGKRFEALKGSPFPNDLYENFTYPIKILEAQLSYTENPFDFKIVQAQNNVVLFSTYDSPFIFSDYYIEITTQIHNDLIFGLGERFSTNFRKTNGKWTVYNQANGQQIDKGTGVTTYGHYPYYMIIENTTTHINYLRNTYPMDIIKSQREGKHYLTFKIIGGVLDFRFTCNEEPIRAILQFHSGLLSPIAIPPFWAMGFHQSKWGYDSAAKLQEVIANYKRTGLPLDAIWSDIDYMDGFKDFTVDEASFPLSEMKKITDEYRYVPIVDAGIAVDSEAYKIGHERDVFIKDTSGEQFVGFVWPGDTVFVDFFHPNASAFWGEMLAGLNKKLNFSGIWLDMNEIEQFCDGPCSVPTEPAKFDFSRDLPYQPGNKNIEAKTIPLNSTHYGRLKEFDIHPYFSLLQAQATYKYLKDSGKRPFIISRSTTFGSNRYTSHWTGDNHASWQFLKSSIVDNMNMNLAGIQMVGPDICGYGGNTTVELCARWFQMAAIYPFARSHNDYQSNPQQPYSMGSVVLESAMTNLKLRYSLLKQYYASIFVYDVYPFFRSVALEYPFMNDIQDKATWDEVANTQIVIGHLNLMAAPILEEGKTSRDVYFPNYNDEGWSDFYTGKFYKPGFTTIQNIKLSDRIPLFLRNNYLVLIQNVTEVTKTSQLTSNFTLISALSSKSSKDSQYSAKGIILAINNNENQKDLQKCADNICLFMIFTAVNIIDSNVELYVHTLSFPTYKSGKIYVERFRLYIDGQVINYTPSEQLLINEQTKMTYNFPYKPKQGNDNFWQSIGVQKSSTEQDYLLTRQ